MPCVIKFVGTAIGVPHAADGCYLRAFDPAPPPGSTEYDGGDLWLTEDLAEAKRFEEIAEAYRFWLTEAPYPFHVRPDGKPNRPLTAFTIEVVRV